MRGGNLSRKIWGLWDNSGRLGSVMVVVVGFGSWWWCEEVDDTERESLCFESELDPLDGWRRQREREMRKSLCFEKQKGKVMTETVLGGIL